MRIDLEMAYKYVVKDLVALICIDLIEFDFSNWPGMCDVVHICLPLQ